MEIIPAILPKNYEDLKNKIALVRGVVPLAQTDICDGVFVPSKTWPFESGLEEHFNKIQKVLLETLATKHSHSEMTEWSKCVGCQIKFRNHAQLMRKLGFKSGKQYREWKKIMDIIINKKRISLR